MIQFLSMSDFIVVIYVNCNNNYAFSYAQVLNARQTRPYFSGRLNRVGGARLPVRLNYVTSSPIPFRKL